MSNNIRLARSANVLSKQVLKKFPDAEWGSVGGPDGLGVVRGLFFKGEAGEFLSRALTHLGDGRISTWSEDQGVVTVSFVDTNEADRVESFPLEAAATVAQAEEPEEPKEKPRTRAKAPKQAPVISGDPVTPTSDDD